MPPIIAPLFFESIALRVALLFFLSTLFPYNNKEAPGD